MPEIHPSAVVSFSSEDKEYPASNLLTPTSFKKWQCAKSGEKSAVVEFQFPKAERISQIDIGNAGSAFIEVLVRRSSGAEGDYQCLLVSSSFMSPLDVRARSGFNRVRIFKTDKLSRLVQEQKWDRAKVVCSQPFTKTEQFGLSFIRFYSTETAEEDEEKSKMKKQGTLGGFVIRDKGSDDEDEVGTNSGLFKKAMDEKKAREGDSGGDETPKTTPSNVATQIRAASKAAETERRKTKESKDVKKAEVAAAKSPASTPPTRKRSSEEDEGAGSSHPTPKRHKKDDPNEKAKNSGPKNGGKPRKKKDSDESDSGDASTSLSSIMRGVEFVLSGYQNPLRARLRDMATGMGAKYRANWGRGCTHLICAFVATPKYKEVSGKGRIVTDKWILDSHKRRKLLPWRNYRLGRAPSPSGSEDEESPKKRRRPPPSAMQESNDEEEDEDEEVVPSRKRRAPPARRAAHDDDEDDWNDSSDEADSEEEMRKKKRERMKKKRGGDSEDEWRPTRKDRDEESDSEPDAEIEDDESEEEEDEEEEVMPKKKDRSKAPPARAESPKKTTREKKVTKKATDLSDSEEEEKPKPAAKKETTSPVPKKKKVALLLDSGSDSDGGWAPIRRKKAGSSSPEKAKNSSPSKIGAKDEDKGEDEEEDETRADLPTFFNASFFMYGKFDGGLQRAVRRIIIAYGGKLEAYMTDSVKYVVTVSDWDDNFDDALMTNSSLIFVRPQWLLECDQKRRFVPYQKFQVVG